MANNPVVTGEIVDEHPTTALVNMDPIVMPAVSPEAALEAWKAYQALTVAIASDDDYQEVDIWDSSLGRKVKRKLPKKSLWRKRATFFNLTLELMSENEIKNEDGSIDFDVNYKAVAPNGRSTIGDGSCNSKEKNRENSRHNTRSTAHTRAFNRAVSNLIGGGEPSAEEFVDESGHGSSAGTPRSSAPPKPLAEVTYDPTYRIDLGVRKDGTPYSLNGMTLEEAYNTYNRATKQSALKDFVDWLEERPQYRPPKIRIFLEQAEAFYKIKEVQ